MSPTTAITLGAAAAITYGALCALSALAGVILADLRDRARARRLRVSEKGKGR